MRKLVMIGLTIALGVVGCRGTGGGTDGDGDSDSDSDGDRDDDDGTNDGGSTEQVYPVCRESGCPDDWFQCSGDEDGNLSCQGQRPVTPDRGDWWCEVEGPHALERAQFVCHGSTSPTSPGPWSCEPDEYGEGFICSRESYWPEAGEGDFWDCQYEGERVNCTYRPGVPAVCRTEPCPDNWFITLGSGVESHYRSAQPATPLRGMWTCEVTGGHDLTDAIYQCFGDDTPPGPSGWSCELDDFEGFICQHPAYWPDLGGEARWDCSYVGSNLLECHRVD